MLLTFWAGLHLKYGLRCILTRKKKERKKQFFFCQISNLGVVGRCFWALNASAPVCNIYTKKVKRHIKALLVDIIYRPAEKNEVWSEFQNTDNLIIKKYNCF